jgi:Cu(I)/Ag(I) efflux system membrane fusion protein
MRFLFVLLAVALLVGYWSVLRNHWDKLTRPAAGHEGALSSDTEYWCPMCPGVVSDWPDKCPVCNMALVRRKKGEMVPLPNGVVARMQLSPYRVQLAGIRTSPVEYRPLTQEATLAGVVQLDELGAPSLDADVLERDIPLVAPGGQVEISSKVIPGHCFTGQIRRRASQLTPGSRTLRVRIGIDDPRHELLPGMLITARCRVPIAQLGWFARARRNEWRDRLAIELIAHSLWTPSGAPPPAGLELLLRTAAEHALHTWGRVLAVPESAVVDTGAKKVVYVETMPSVFDGLEVVLGRRCGGFYPVLRGLEPGQRAVTAGAFLLDAETRLDPSIAASYFGAGPDSRRAPASQESGTLPTATEPGAQHQNSPARQRVCPVTGEPLDSMGGPVRVVIEGQTVFLCCKHCEPALRKDPGKYLDKLRGK